MPSKKTLIFAASCFVALGVIIFAVKYSPKHQITQADNVAVINVQSQSEIIKSQLTETDSDNDGLKDWEEALWGSDPKKSDSDGDGVSDGQEIKNGTNPTKKGPNDKLSEKDLPTTAIKSTSTAELSVKQKVAQNLFNHYLQLKQAGLTINDSTQEELVNEFLKDTNNQVSVAKSYSSTDIFVASSESKDSIKAYGNQVADVLKKNNPRSKNPELIWLTMAVENNDPTYLKNIAIIDEAYQKMIKDLKSVSVPPSAVTLHTSLMTSISELYTSGLGMQKVLDDAIAGTFSINLYQTGAQDLQDDFVKYKAYFANKGVTYSSSESGYRFVK